MANKQDALKEALATYLEPITLAANSTRFMLGLPPADITERPEIRHQIDYFIKGFNEGKAGYYDKWYDDKIAAKAYQAGNAAGREFYKGEHFQTIEFNNY